jgi:penicillin-binding protein 2
LPTLPEDRKYDDIGEKPLLRDDPKFATGKIAFLQYFVVAVFLFLSAGFWKLQVQDQGIYDEAAERNRIKTLPLPAPRGKILDRDGRVIVDNHSSFRLILSRENLKEEHLPAIAVGLHLDLDDLIARLRRFSSRPRYVPITIKQELTQGELAFVESHRDSETFPEMEVIQTQSRVYPANNIAAHAIGYIGEVSESELDLADFARYSQGDVLGKAGIERQYNDVLMGVDGQRRVMVDNQGRERELIDYKPAVPGTNLQLTIDLDLQSVAELAMETRKRGAVVALDPRSGEVLAMVSFPAFDPNLFAGRISTADYKALTTNPDKPFVNRAIQGQLAPGSTFKPIMALAGLETGTIDEHTAVVCQGGQSFFGHYHACHLKRGHGTVDLHRGIGQSCDVYFYNLGNRMGIDNIARYAEMAGFGKKTGIDLPYEQEGIVPSPKWKVRTFRQKWYAGETISVAIGQGALTVTPLQLANAVAGIAMGGVWYKPHLVKEPARLAPPRKEQLDPINVQRVVDGMYGVVNEGGTGYLAHLPGIELCGKTGTAQLASNEYVKAHKLDMDLTDNAWFVGFAPRENPEIVVVALLEGGKHGPAAAPIVRDVIKAYFDKKASKSKSGAAPSLALNRPGGF